MPAHAPSVPRLHADHLDALARAHAAFLAAVDALTPEVRGRRPSADAWSPVEVLEHLVLAEEATLRSIERRVAGGAGCSDLGAPPRWKAAALMVAVASPFRFRVPARARAVHPAGAPSDALRAGFAGFDARWRALAEVLPDALVDAGLMRHPVAGPLTAADAARFTAAHVERHRRQVGRAARTAA